WFVDSLIRVFPSDSPGTHELATPELWGARNQHLAVQLALRSSKHLSSLSAEIPSIEDGNGQEIPSVTVQPGGYVVVGSHSTDTPEDELVGETPGWYADPLMDFPLELKANRTYALWGTIPIPANAKPGAYRGAIVISTDGRQLARAEFSLNVAEA